MKRMLISSAVLVACATGLLFADAIKVPGKVGYVSSMEVINSSKVGKEIKGKLDAAFKKSGAEVQAEEQKITKAVNEYKVKESDMSDIAKEAEQAKLMKSRRDFEAMVQEKDEEMKRLQAKLNEQLTKEALATAVELAQAEGLDAVIDTDSGKVLFVAPAINYTSKFTDRMNKNYDAQNTKNNAKNDEQNVKNNLQNVKAVPAKAKA
jgi:Skp family chaperone for outer membrane proteins